MKPISYLRFLIVGFIISVSPVQAVSINGISANSSSVRVYEKFEVKFNITTDSQYPFFQYDENPPPGVTSKTGITVEGVFTNTTTNKTFTQPAFYMTEVTRSGNGSNMVFTETANKYWMIRFSPRETGSYQLTIRARDASGQTTANGPGFTATAPVKHGFIRVSDNDNRYFEFSDGTIFWPVGPAWGSTDFSQYLNTGTNFVRIWMGGMGAYSTNWARWISSAENDGNEGIMTRLSFAEKYTGRDLSYEMIYPASFRYWLPVWGEQSALAARFKTNTTYHVKLRYKTSGITGPRVSGQPYGLVAKVHGFESHKNTPDTTDNNLRNKFRLFNHFTQNQGWTVYEGNVTTPGSLDGNDISIYLDNVTAGQANIDEFSVKEVVGSGLGGELVRNPVADVHTYVDPRATAYFDWQIEQGEANGVYFKYVVHDKNDWIQQHLRASDGAFVENNLSGGYYQAENTKARWLLRQWYRYLAARYGYSTAIHTWELNNEGPPNDDPAGSNTAPHWRTAQAFAQFMHQTDAQPHLVTTSFWCCWRPSFWGGANFPDVDYADIHEYTGTPGVNPAGNVYDDMAQWNYGTGKVAYDSQVGKPVMRSETAITDNGTQNPVSALQSANPGIWFHNLLWAGLSEAALYEPGYWFPQHFTYIDRFAITKAFYAFVKDLDLNRGGFGPLQATISNPKIRTYGQKNNTGGKAIIWIQNSDHTWKKYMDGVRTSYSGTISFIMTPNTAFRVEWWNTITGTISSQQNLNSNQNGQLSLSVANLADDVAVKVFPAQTFPSASPTNAADVNRDGFVNSADLKLVILNYLGVNNCGNYVCDVFDDQKINILDAVWVLKNL